MLWFNTRLYIYYFTWWLSFFQKERGINHWNSDKSLFHVWAYLLYMIRHDTPWLLFNDFQIVHVQVFTKVRPVSSDADWVIIAWIYLKHWLGNYMTLSISGGSILTELQTHPANMNHTGECRPTILGPMSLQVPTFPTATKPPRTGTLHIYCTYICNRLQCAHHHALCYGFYPADSLHHLSHSGFIMFIIQICPNFPLPLNNLLHCWLRSLYFPPFGPVKPCCITSFI